MARFSAGIVRIAGVWGAAILATGCAQSHEGGSCADMGGRCQTPDLPCGPEEVWAGYEPCGDVLNNSCCVPSAERDAGPPSDPPLRDAGPPPDARPDAASSDAGSPRDAGALETPFCLQHDQCTGDDACTDAWDERFCTVLCSAAATDCPEGRVCHVPGDIAGYCVARCDVDGGCPLGFACDDDGGCLPSRCERDAPDEGTPGCCYDQDDCDDGFRCYEASCLEGRPGRCLPFDGEGCWYDADCTSTYRRDAPMRCEGALLDAYACTDPRSSVGVPGTCVPR